MRKSEQPRCFVAMAFEPKDVNVLYETQIRPLLRRLDIVPVVIGKRQSNEDLNIQIIANLRDCDFCIADLTYARPSVYFEAGFAQRSCEVIYTVRRDHLKSGQPESLRVHFDLQMKPLVAWKDPKDPTFQSRLEKRVRGTFLRQWKKDQTLNEMNEAALKEFSLLPQYKRVALLRSAAIAAFRKTGFSSWQAPKQLHRSYTRREIASGAANNVLSVMSDRNTMRVASVHAYPSLRKAELEDLRQRFSPWRIEDDLGPETVGHAKAIPVRNVVLSLSPTRAEAIEAVFSALKPEEPPVHYSGFVVLRDRASQVPERRTLLSVDWIFLTGIKSRPHLKSLLDKYVVEQMKAEAA